ncbi:MAG: type I-E CRISPR-associated protein Cse1/CasA [Candidatus Riflebacteria bacterium]|nr:type I-E CRISPR-associated protein Cse1/CasA [Candidatus Riflebacteria bacterium]
MPETKGNLLTEPIIGVRLVGGERREMTLPEVLEGLEGDAIEAFTALQPHQKHAWHAFLVQLAAIALHQAGRSLPVKNAADWATLLRALTNGRDEPWTLVVKDLSQPAFMQPPIPEGNLKEFRPIASFPDELDILVTAKNHDVKLARCGSPQDEHWLYALLSLQTMQGFLGAGNYGVARMNGGFSNRPCVTFAPNLNFGQRFSRDVTLLLHHRHEIAPHLYSASGGQALLWVQPWDGTSSLALDACDPFFIEVCRRVRLLTEPAGIVAKGRPTKCARLQAGEVAGNTGDPWTPVNHEGKALTIPRTGFSYRRTQELLVGSDFAPGCTQRISPRDPAELLFVGWALVRGQGKTEGLHQRTLRIPGHIRRSLAAAEGKVRLEQLAKRRVTVVGEVQKGVLKPALCALLQAGKDTLDFSDERPRRWIDRHESAVDDVFFDHLWADAELDPAEADRRWQTLVLDLARHQLQHAMTACPLPAARRYRAWCAAERLFFGLARKKYPEVELRQGGMA